MATFRVIAATVVVAAAFVAFLQPMLGFPPLVLFVVPGVAALRMGGRLAALTAALAAAFVADFLFVAPVREVTVVAEGLRLLIALLLSVVLASLFVRRGPQRTS